MDVFFVPKDQEKINQVSQDDVSKQVLFSCGFSYQGARAYDRSVRLKLDGEFEAEKNNAPQIGNYERVRILRWDSLHDFVEVNLENFIKEKGRIYKESIAGKERKFQFKENDIIYAYVKCYVEKTKHWELVLSESELDQIVCGLRKWKRK